MNLDFCGKGEHVSNVYARRVADNFGDTFTSEPVWGESRLYLCKAEFLIGVEKNLDTTNHAARAIHQLQVTEKIERPDRMRGLQTKDRRSKGQIQRTI